MVCLCLILTKRRGKMGDGKMAKGLVTELNDEYDWKEVIHNVMEKLHKLKLSDKLYVSKNKILCIKNIGLVKI